MAVCSKKKEKKSGRNGLAETQPIFVQATTTHQLRSWQRTPSPHPNLWLSLTLHPLLSISAFISHTHTRKNGNTSEKQNQKKTPKKTARLQPRKLSEVCKAGTLAVQTVVSRGTKTISQQGKLPRRASKRASALPDPGAAPHPTSSRRVTAAGDVGGQFSDLTETKIGGYGSSESTFRSGEQEVPNFVSLTTFFFVSRQKKRRGWWGEVDRKVVRHN